jgi:hypothetical protein
VSEKGHLPNLLPSGWDENLCELLHTRCGLPVEKAESLTHALVDVLESVVQVYGTTIPGILGNTSHIEIEMLQDMVWDIREEFRHIDYHVHESGMLEI